MPTEEFGQQPRNHTGEVGTQPRTKSGWTTVGTTGDKAWSSTVKHHPLKHYGVARKKP